MKYILEKAKTPGYWVCTDTENLIVCVFKDKNFNSDQKFTLLEESTLAPVQLARVAREIADWLRKNHYDKVL